MPGVNITDLSGKSPHVPMVGKGTPLQVINNRTGSAQQQALNATASQAGGRVHVIA